MDKFLEQDWQNQMNQEREEEVSRERLEKAKKDLEKAESSVATAKTPTQINSAKYQAQRLDADAEETQGKIRETEKERDAASAWRLGQREQLDKRLGELRERLDKTRKERDEKREESRAKTHEEAKATRDEARAEVKQMEERVQKQKEQRETREKTIRENLERSKGQSSSSSASPGRDLRASSTTKFDMEMSSQISARDAWYAHEIGQADKKLAGTSAGERAAARSAESAKSASKSQTQNDLAASQKSVNQQITKESTVGKEQETEKKNETQKSGTSAGVAKFLTPVFFAFMLSFGLCSGPKAQVFRKPGAAPAPAAAAVPAPTPAAAPVAAPAPAAAPPPLPAPMRARKKKQAAESDAEPSIAPRQMPQSSSAIPAELMRSLERPKLVKPPSIEDGRVAAPVANLRECAGLPAVGNETTPTACVEMFCASPKNSANPSCEKLRFLKKATEESMKNYRNTSN